MASITEKPRALEESHGRVRGPLEKLRGTIRTYISLEGLVLIGLYLSLWFWIGMVLDYGFFKAFTIDWVQILPTWFRGGILVVLLAGLMALVATRVVMRLARDFRAAALALVLERRFPKLLGDRLITAVELADPKEAEKLGYSRVMVEQTIHDAARLVDQAPVSQVFDWQRLTRGGIRVGILTLGLYVVATLIFNLQPRHIGFKSPLKDWQIRWTGDGMRHLNEVSAIWFERNILLRNSIWPRRSLLQLVGFPEDGVLTIGKGDPAPGIRVKAFRWVIADRASPEGWRAMRWDEIHDVVGHAVDTTLIPEEWLKREGAIDAGLSVDEAELNLDKPEMAKALGDSEREGIQKTLAELEAKVSQSGSRKWRLLQIPDIVYVNTKGESGKSEITLQKSGDNEFAGEFSTLNENITFEVHGEDYWTRKYRITVVPPPGMIELLREEHRPAYLYYRVPKDGKAADLIGKFQVERDIGANVVGAESIKITLPLGSDLILTGKTDKDLAQAPKLAQAGKGTEALKSEAALMDSRHFQVRFDKVRGKIEFTAELIDTDHVRALRRIEIIPQPDQPPAVDDFRVGDMIRRTPQGYMVTPVALIPFSGRAHDDVALESVEFAYSLVKLDKQAEQNLRGLLLLSAAVLTPGAMGQEIYTAATVASVSKNTKQLSPEEEAKEIRRLPLAVFQKKLSSNPQEYFSLEAILANLDKSPPERKLLNDFLFDPTDAETSFDLKPLGLEVPKETGEPQPKYKFLVWVEATDNNIETGPGHSLVKERLPFIIVSEEELLAAIGQDEEQEYGKLSDVVSTLKQSQDKLNTIKADLTAANVKAESFGTMSVRAEELDTQLEKHKLIVGEVKTKYDLILKELKANRVAPDWIQRVEKDIVKPLETALVDEVGDFANAAKALKELRDILDNKDLDPAKKAAQANPALDSARTRHAELEKRLVDVLEKMSGILDLKKLLKVIKDIDDGELKLAQRYKDMRQQLEAAFFTDEKKDEPKKEK